MRRDWKYGLLFILLFNGSFEVQADIEKLTSLVPVKTKAEHCFSFVGNLPKFTFFSPQSEDTSVAGKKSTPQQKAQTEKALRKTTQMRKAAEAKVGEFFKKRYCIGNNMISSYSKEAALGYEAQFGPKLEELEKLTAVLHNLVQEGPQTNNSQKLTVYQQRLTSLIKEITTGYTEICEAEQTLCGCYSG